MDKVSENLEDGKAVALIKAHMLNRFDRLAFFAPWGKACPIDANGNLDDILTAHLLGDRAPSVTVKWIAEKKGTSGFKNGRFRVGTYSPAPNGKTMFGCIDADGGGRHGHPLAKPLLVAIAIVMKARELGLPAYLEKSGGGAGWHVWFFFAEPVSARDVRRLLFAMIPADAKLADGLPADPQGNKGVEVFPKQDAIAEGAYGNLVWLPWWSEGKDGANHFHLIDDSGNVTAYFPDDFATIAAPELAAALAKLERTGTPEEQSAPSATVSEEELATIFPEHPERKREPPPKESPERTREVMLEAIQHVPNGLTIPYEGSSKAPSWLGMGMAIHSVEPTAAGLKVWEDWSAQCKEKHNKKCTCAEKWNSFGKYNGKNITIGSLIMWAKANGWRGPTSPTIANFRWESKVVDDEEKFFRIGLSQQSIRSQIIRIAGDWPKSAAGTLFVEGPDHQPLFLESPHQLFAWLAGKLPENKDNKLLWLNSGESMVSRTQYYEYERQAAERFDSVEGSPHFPDMPGHYYLHPKIHPGDGSHLSAFLDFFCYATPIDRQLMLACIASLVWGGPCGKRPGWLFTGPDGDKRGGRGVGKTTAAEKLAELIGGVVAIKDTENCKAIDVEKRLLSKEGRRRRVLLIDNLKALKFSWAYIESFITQEVISGTQLYEGEGRRPNNLTVIITANGASLSVDMAQRSNVLKFGRPNYSGNWDQDISDFIAKHRWDILADLMALFQRPAEMIESPSRWGPWQQAVLARLDNPTEVQRVLAERSLDHDEDAEESGLVRDEIRKSIQTLCTAEGELMDLDPDKVKVRISAKALGEIVNRATNEKRPTPQATGYAMQLQIPELRRAGRKHGRCYWWIGADADMNKPADAIIGAASGGDGGDAGDDSSL